MLDVKLLSILVCPNCKGELHYDKTANELICYGDALAYPIKEGIPIMLTNEARGLTPEEREEWKKELEWQQQEIARRKDEGFYKYGD